MILWFHFKLLILGCYFWVRTMTSRDIRIHHMMHFEPCHYNEITVFKQGSLGFLSCLGFSSSTSSIFWFRFYLHEKRNKMLRIWIVLASLNIRVLIENRCQRVKNISKYLKIFLKYRMELFYWDSHSYSYII